MQPSQKSTFRMIITAIGMVVLTPILTIPMLVSALLVKPGKFAYFMMKTWNKTISKLMGLRFSLSGVENLDSNTSYIITPNHQGLADILAIVSTLPVRFRWVVKRELFKIPVWGLALWSTGAIPIDRSNSVTAIERLNKEKDEKLKGGWSVVIYPEGTRTPDGNLKDFKKGAFMMAVHTGIPILPVVCNGAFKVLPKKTFAFRRGHIKLNICPPILTQGLSEKDVPELMSRTREAILAKLRLDYDPFLNEEPCT